jgi:hypothetical protein
LTDWMLLWLLSISLLLGLCLDSVPHPSPMLFTSPTDLLRSKPSPLETGLFSIEPSTSNKSLVLLIYSRLTSHMTATWNFLPSIVPYTALVPNALQIPWGWRGENTDAPSTASPYHSCTVWSGQGLPLHKFTLPASQTSQWAPRRPGH